MDMDAAFANWLAGFIAGEGTFVILRTQNRNKGHGAPGSIFYNARLAVRLRHDDAPILHEIVARTGWGVVHNPKPSYPTQRPQAEWVVCRKAHLEEVVYFLDFFPLRAKKAEAFAVWSGAILWWVGQVPDKVTRYDWKPMARARDELRLMNGYRDPTTGTRTATPARPRSRPRTRVLAGRDYDHASEAQA